MARTAKKITTRFVGSVCALAVMSCSQSVNDLKSLPTIKADKTHQIDIEKKNNISYEVPIGRGFLIDTSEYRKEYEQAGSLTLDRDVSKSLRLDPVAPTKAHPVSIDLVPDRDLYQICPEGGLQSGDKFTVQIVEEITDWGHYNCYPRWRAYISVK